MSEGRKGRKFGYDTNEVWFFGSEGLRRGSGQYLTRETALKKRHAWRDEREANGAMTEILSVVEQARTAHPTTTISRIQITSRLAVLLYLRGHLKKESLDKARLNTAESYVAVPDVVIMPGVTTKLWVMSDAHMNGLTKHYSIRVVAERNTVLAER